MFIIKNKIKILSVRVMESGQAKLDVKLSNGCQQNNLDLVQGAVQCLIL